MIMLGIGKRLILTNYMRSHEISIANDKWIFPIPCNLQILPNSEHRK